MHWVVSSKVGITSQEEERLSTMAKRIPELRDEPLLQTLAAVEYEDLEEACRALREIRDTLAQREALQQVVTVALEDKRITVAKNYLIRFAADLLGILAADLHELLVQRTGRPLSEPGDVSSAAWWEQREREVRVPEPGPRATHSAPPPPAGAPRVPPSAQGPGSQILRALATLGLEYGASVEEIRAAYRRLAQVHHPDRFTHLNADSAQRASEVFRRIQEAYELLTGK